MRETTMLAIYGRETWEAIKRFVEVAFKSQESLFTLGTRIWSIDVRAKLARRLAQPEFSGGGDFMQKLETHLKGAPRPVIQLAAELLYAQLLTPGARTIGFQKKVSLVEKVLNWSDEPVRLPDELKAGLKGGLATDEAFTTHRGSHLKLLLETLRAWWDDQDDASRAKLLTDPWAFKTFLEGITATKAYSMREILYFYVHPSHFEAITSREKKKEFAKEFGHLLKASTGDDDKDLLAIREVLSKEYGEQFHFFEERIRKPPVGAPEEAKMKALLEQFRQIIVYGPPGTGKTREAKRVALALLAAEKATAAAASTDKEIEEKLKPDRDAGRFDLVVFHPAYEYEQFVGGIEPMVKDGHLVFQAKAGVFLRLCRAAEKHQQSAVLIIDEINRGNLPKLLGELVYALEYRDHEVRLPFICDGRTDLIVPKNLHIIATMNSADRSIGHIDVAIRRRFGLYHLPPNSAVVEKEWSMAGDAAYGVLLAKLMQRLNKMLATGNDPSAEAEMGVGHSYFLPAPGSSVEAAQQQVQMKWEYQVQPLLREYAQLLNLGADFQAFFKKSLAQALAES